MSKKRFEGRGDFPYNPATDPRKPTYKVEKWEIDNLIAGFAEIKSKDTKLDTTLQVIQDFGKRFTNSVYLLAQRLKTGNKEQDAYHVWHFIKTNIRYRLDPRGTEKIRNPKASFRDRIEGVDCEDYSIFCVCLLRAMNYNPHFIIVAFNNKKNFGHIYAELEGFAMDCVLGQFNQHPPNVTKRRVVKINDLLTAF